MSEKVISAAVHAGVRAELVLRSMCIMKCPLFRCQEGSRQCDTAMLMWNGVFDDEGVDKYMLF